ncbi:MAG: leucine-rich repeat domain-containing protein [Paludibacteraceae bacterium]|nr:leucine-rich repeat domain-containing protein [Paludibacteraceae bacterium]
MRKIRMTALLAVLSLTSVLTGQTFESRGIAFRIDGENAIVVNKTEKYAGEVIIPAEVRHGGKCYRVTEIGDRAFAGCRKLMSVMATGNALLKVGNAAFSGCMFLESVVLPQSVTTIGDDAFHMTNVSTIQLPSSLTTLGKRAFYFSALTEINLPPSLTRVDQRTFAGCNSLVLVRIPATTTQIADDAFLNCPNLKNILVDPANPSFLPSTDGVLKHK